MANIKDPLYADFHLPSGTLWARWNFCEDFENPSNTWNNKQSYILPASLCKLSDLDEDENGVSKYNKHKVFYRKVYTASIEIPSHKIEENNQNTSLYVDGITYININLLDEFGDDIWDKSTDEAVDLIFNYIYDHNSSAQLLIDRGKYITTYINDITSNEGFIYAFVDSSPEPDNTEVNNLFKNQPKLSSYHILNIPNYDSSFGRYGLSDTQQDWFDDTTRRFDMFVKDNINHWKSYIKKCLNENKVAPLISINKEYKRKDTFDYFKDTYNGIEVFKTLYKNKGLQAGTQWDIVTNEYGGWRMPTDQEWNELYIYTKQREINIPSNNWTASTVYVSGVEFYNDYDSIIIPNVNKVYNSKLNIDDKSLKNLNKLHRYGYYDYEKFYAMHELSMFDELNHLSPDVVEKKWTWRWPFSDDTVRGFEFGYGCINSNYYHKLKFNSLTLADENTSRTISWDKAKELYDDYFENTIFPDFDNTNNYYNRNDNCWFGNGWASLTPFEINSEFKEDKFTLHSLLDANKLSVYINEHITGLSETTQRDSIIDLVNEHDTSIVYGGLANSWKYSDESKQQGKENLYVNQLSNIELPSSKSSNYSITTNSYGDVIAPFLTPIRPVKNTEVYKLSNGPESSEKYDAYIKHTLDYTVDEVKKEHLNTIKFVDLGLTSGTLWATENIGSTSLSSYGKVYYFGQENDNDDLSKFDDMKSSDAIELFQNAFKNLRYYESGKEYGNIQKTKYDLVYKLYNKFYGLTDIVTPTWSQWNELLTECTLKVFPHEAMIKYLGSNEYTDIELGGYTIMCTSKKYPDRYILLQLGGNMYQGSWYPVINTSKSTSDGFSQYLTSSVLKPFKQDENNNYVYSNELFNDYAKYIGDESYSLPVNGLDINKYFGVGVVINNDFTRHYYSPTDDAILADSLLSFEPLLTSGYLLDGKTYGTYHGNSGYMVFGKLRPVCLPNGILPEIEGDNQGGDNQGGDNQGGDNQGGDNQGGDNQGGDNQGGDNQGGDNQGGDSSGHNIDPLPDSGDSSSDSSSNITNNITYEVSNPVNEIKVNVDYSNIPQPKEETESDKKKQFIRDTARELYVNQDDLSHPKINASDCYDKAIVLANVIFNDPDETGKLQYYTNDEVDNLINKLTTGELNISSVYTKNEIDNELTNIKNSISAKTSDSSNEISQLRNDITNLNTQISSMKNSIDSEINNLKAKINELIGIINNL